MVRFSNCASGDSDVRREAWPSGEVDAGDASDTVASQVKKGTIFNDHVLLSKEIAREFWVEDNRAGEAEEEENDVAIELDGVTKKLASEEVETSHSISEGGG